MKHVSLYIWSYELEVSFWLGGVKHDTMEMDEILKGWWFCIAISSGKVNVFVDALSRKILHVSAMMMRNKDY